MSRSQIRGGQIKDDSITGDDVDESTLVLNTLRDADGDTKVQVEKTSDEDKIRFDTAGVERMTIIDDGTVGIGNTTPVARLEVLHPGSSLNNAADQLVSHHAACVETFLPAMIRVQVAATQATQIHPAAVWD